MDKNSDCMAFQQSWTSWESRDDLFGQLLPCQAVKFNHSNFIPFLNFSSLFKTFRLFEELCEGFTVDGNSTYEDSLQF